MDKKSDGSYMDKLKEIRASSGLTDDNWDDLWDGVGECNKYVPEYKFALVDRVKGDVQFLPNKAEPKANGWDVRAAIDDDKISIPAFHHFLIPLGIRGFCPDGWGYRLKPRSSTFAKKYLHCLYGEIDETFQGELQLACQYIPHSAAMSPPTLTINFGDALGQIIPVRRQEMIVSEISNEEYDALCKERNGVRGEGGFGSTTPGFVKYGEK